MGSVCCPHLANKQPRRSSTNPAAVGGIRRVPEPVQPTSERGQLAVYHRERTEEQFQRIIKQNNGKPKTSAGGLSENINLTNMKTTVVTKNKEDGLENRSYSRSTTVVTKSMKLERTVSYLVQKESLKNFLSQPPSVERKQEVLVLPRKIINFDSDMALKNNFYSLIANKAFVKKPQRGNFKVNSPVGKFELVCHPELVKQTIFLTEGIPIQNVKLLNSGSDNVNIVTQPNFELQINLVLQCLQCQKISKYQFSVAYICLNFVCQCGCKDFKILQIGSPKDIPLWIDSQKIKKPVQYVRGSYIRAFGCMDCWCFKQCTTLACGCWKCKNCLPNSGAQCMLCDTQGDTQ